MLVTNPGSNKYELYASTEIITYFKENICQQITEQIHKKLQTPCYLMIETARPQIRMTVQKHTKQNNFLLFSIYQTNISIPPIIPEYHFETLGILDRFYTYQVTNNE